MDRLPVLLPGHKYVHFKTGESLQQVCDRANLKMSKLEAWFIANKNIPSARKFTYFEFPSHFSWLPRECKWKERQRGDVEDIRNVNGHVYDIFKDTCAALGLLQSDSQWHETILGNSQLSFPNQLREMFVDILTYCSVSDPLSLWNGHWVCMSDDILHNRRAST